MEDSIFRLYYMKLRRSEQFLPKLSNANDVLLGVIKNSLGYSSFRFQILTGRLFREISRETGFTRLVRRLLK